MRPPYIPASAKLLARVTFDGVPYTMLGAWAHDATAHGIETAHDVEAILLEKLERNGGDNPAHALSRAHALRDAAREYRLAGVALEAASQHYLMLAAAMAFEAGSRGGVAWAE